MEVQITLGQIYNMIHMPIKILQITPYTYGIGASFALVAFAHCPIYLIKAVILHIAALYI